MEKPLEGWVVFYLVEVTQIILALTMQFSLCLLFLFLVFFWGGGGDEDE